MNSVYVQAEAGVDNVTIGGSQSFGVSLGADNDSLTVTGLLGGVGGGQLIDMGDGSDTVSLQDVDAVVTISLGEGANSLTMKDFGPSYGGNSQSILAGTGNDTIKAGAFNDMYLADLGGDNIITLGNQTAYYAGAWLETGAGNDSMTVGDFGAIRFILGDGANQLNAGNGYAEVFAGSGSDTINLGDGPHVITTGAGNDSVSTGSGASSIDTGLGNDTISAGAGNDTLFGGADADVLTGGSGADVFIYDILAGGLDRITDYEVGVDVIQIGGFDPALWGTDGLGNGTYTPSVGNVLTVVGIIDATQITWA
ncbi:MAG: hypothetical protein EAZ99_17380 [Alphaproteobacteria bacterium]|nr:MAG: hypothetical protein EAZ99_17380 [Alphaproteobacteria bacterium]